MVNLAPRAHLPAVRFSSRAYMGCGGWDLAQAPELAVPSLESARRSPGGSTRLFSRPRRALSCAGVNYGPEVEEETELSGRRRVTMGCGDEPCEECKAKGIAQMGCPKCKRVRQRAMMNREDELRGRLGQELPTPTEPTIVGLAVAGLTITGIFYFATR